MRGPGPGPSRPRNVVTATRIQTKALTLFEKYCIWLKNNHARLEFCTPKTMRGLSTGLTWPCDVETVTRKLKEEPTSLPSITTTVSGKATQGTVIN